MGRGDRPLFLKLSARWWAQLAAAIVLTVGALLWALYERQHAPDWPWPSVPSPRDAMLWMIQIAIVPLALVALLGRIGLLAGSARGEHKLLSFAALVLIGVLTDGYGWWTGNEIGKLGLMNWVVLVLGAQQGGWKAGFGLGLAVAFVRGTRAFAFSPMDDELLHLIRTLGISKLLGQPGIYELLWFYGTARVWVPLWAGCVAGLCAELLGQRRYKPLAALALGCGVTLGGGGLMYLARHLPNGAGLLPLILVAGAATFALAWMVHRVQAWGERPEAADGWLGGWIAREAARLPVPGWAIWGIVLALATLVTLGLAFQARQFHLDVLDVHAALTQFEFNPYWVGLIVQRTVVPAILIYVLSTTALFRRVAGEKGTKSDRTWLFAALAIAQLLTHGYEFWFGRLVREPPLFGFLVVVVGGLLAGPKAAVGLGLITALARGLETWWPMVGREVAFSIQERGMAGLIAFPWVPLLLGNQMVNVWLSLALWRGAIIGLYVELSGKHRFAPWAVVLLGLFIESGIGGFALITGEPPAIVLLLPSMLVSAMAMAVLALVVRNVQAEDTRRRAETAELALARAGLRALRAQINPHFLFNALNTIRYFVRTDPETARELLLDLSEVFQRALRSGEFVALRDELGYVEAYLALENARLGDRLRVEWSLGGDELMDRAVPTLILQPLVENAVLHGIAKEPSGGRVWITVKRMDGDLVLRVEDDGTGISPERLGEVLGPKEAADSSVGLRNVDGRLRALYGADHGLSIQSEIGRGTRVEIRIPREE